MTRWRVTTGRGLVLVTALTVLALLGCSEDGDATDGGNSGVDVPAPVGTAPSGSSMDPLGTAPMTQQPASPAPGATDTGAPPAAGQQTPPGQTPPPDTQGPVAGSDAMPPMTTTPPPSGSGCLQGGGDYLAMGPYATASMDVEIGANGPFTIFYPQPLDEDCQHPIVAWGNGTGVTGSGTYAFYNDHAASWGIVVIASHNSNVGSGEFHKAGLDYLLQQNDDPSSMFYQRLSPRAGTSGHSQGGMGADAGATHPNVEAEVNVQGAFRGAPAGVAFLCLTGTADINPAGCASATAGAGGPALLANWEGGDHFGTATLAGFIGGDAGTMQYMRLYSAWFRCFLADDAQACSLFSSPCAVCSDPGWAQIQVYNY